MNLPILMYHAVEDRETNGYPFAIPVEQFAQQLDIIKRSGYTTISLGRLFDFLEDERPLPPRPVILTFDDAYSSVCQFAWPLMQVRRMTGSVFAVADHLGGTNEWDQAKAMPTLPLMSAEELGLLSEAGWEIGSHGCRHLNLGEAGLANQQEEIRRSKQRLEEQTKAPIEFYAYPYGAYNETAKQLLHEASYRGAVSMFSKAASVTADKFCLRRVMPHRGDSEWSFRLKLTQPYLRYVAWRDGRRRDPSC